MVHLSADGEELWRSAGGTFSFADSVSVNPTDGSCWVADSGHGQVVHLSAAGEELWRSASGAFSYPYSVSANLFDGSCWVGNLNPGQVVHLSAAGEELWRSDSGAFGQPQSVSVNPTSGSCWVADVRASGQSGLTDGSYRVADLQHNQVVHLAIPTNFSDVPYYHWALHQIDACFAEGVVGGYSDGTYRPAVSVTRDMMAVFISRALAGGDSSVPTGPATATFTDVPTTHWAFKYVEYAADQGVVGGYSDATYRPTITVTRDMMAVFVARAMCGGDASVPTGPATAFFTDVPTTHWAFRYVEYIRGEGVAGGYGDGTYRPLLVVDRASMAVYVQRAFALPM